MTGLAELQPRIEEAIAAHDSAYTRNPHTHEAWWGCSCGERYEGHRDASQAWHLQHRAERLLVSLEGAGVTMPPPRPPQLQPMALAEQQQARHRVRSHGEATSFEAALSLTRESAAFMYGTIYALLVVPMTDDELRRLLTSAGIRHTRSGVSARRSELERAGWVRKTGDKRPSDAGRLANVYAAVPERSDA